MTAKIMTTDDMDIIVPFYMNCYNDDTEEWTYEITYKRIHQVLTKEDSHCFIFTQDEEIIGFAMGYCEQFFDAPIYFLTEIVVIPTHQGKGLGSQMMIHIENYLKNINVSKILLLSANDELHKHFYEKLGYAESKNIICMQKKL